MTKEDKQLEVHIDHALKRHEFQSLEGLLQKEPIPQKCGKDFLPKLDLLFCRELDNKEVKHVSLLLNVLYRFSNYMTLNSEEWLTTAIKQSLVEKIIWFEKIRDILMCAGGVKNEAFLSLTEDYFEFVMVVHDHSNDGKMQILEKFIVRACSLVSQEEINIFIKQEAVRKLNLMLDTMPPESRRKLIFSKEMMAMMSALGKRILDVGDYDLQVAITEALCRMTSEAQRVELASDWFPMEFVYNAFKKIKDAEFETDCRKFLNLVNGMLGDKRRVFTFPCLSAHLESHKLQTPSDEKLEEFWIDFNVGSRSLSFYVSNHDEDHQWETVCITENEVDYCDIEATSNKAVLTVALNTPVKVGQIKGSRLRIFFDNALDIGNVVREVFGAHKVKGFIKKQSISVAKTTVHVIFDENGSQILIPESQESVSSAKNKTVGDASDAKAKKQPPLTTPSSSQQSCNMELDTPSKPKVSEASIHIIVPGAHKPVPPESAKTPSLGKARIKPPLEMMNSVRRKMLDVPSHKDNTSCTKQQMCKFTDVGTTKTSEQFQALLRGGHDEQMDIVPDTQFPVGKNTPILPGFTNTGLGLSKKPARAVHPNRKASVTDEFLSNKDKNVSDLLAEHKKSSTFESEKNAKNTEPTDTSCTKTKMQPQGKSKNTIQERTKPEERAGKRKIQKNVKKPDTSLHKQSRDSDAHSHAYDSAEKSNKNSKKEGTEFQISDNLAKNKESIRPRLQYEKTKCLRDATQSLLANIGSKYSRDVVNKNQATAVCQNINDCTIQNYKGKKVKSKEKETKKKKSDPRDDIYSFQSTEGDNPTIELGVNQRRKTEVSSAFIPKTTARVNVANTEKPSEKKQSLATKLKPKSPRRHLFSDTDTDKGGDDTKTDFSWLKDSSCKKKPKIVGYSRQKQAKPPQQTVSCRANEISKQNRKRKGSPKETVPLGTVKEDNKQVPKYTRSQRGAVKRKCYREVSDSETESEESTRPIRKETPRDQYEYPSTKQKMCIEIPKNPKNCTRRNQKPEDYTETTKLDKTPYKKPAISPISSSPESIDQIRAEHLDLGTTFTQLPSSPSPCSSPSASSPQTVSISTAVKNVSKNWASANRKAENKLGVCETVQKDSSPTISHVSMAHITLDHSTVSGINYLDVPDLDYEQPGNTPSVIGKACVQSNTLTLKKNSGASYHSGLVVKKTSNVTCTTVHESGPTIQKAALDLGHVENESSHLADNSMESSEQWTKYRKLKLLPRRLFPATEEKQPTGSLPAFSRKEDSTGSLDTWERSDSDVGLMCRKIGKDYTQKIQNRSRKIDYFTEQSVKNAQKHLTSVELQVRECRMKHLEKFQQTILAEIEDFEKDSKALKQMEKEFTNFWSQQTQVLSIFHSNEQKRIHCLKASFEKNVSRCTDFEGKIFTSEMHVMKEDMKNVQELLLKKMHEEDLLSVRRGLQSLFMTGAGPF